jgi:hypothetical protein
MNVTKINAILKTWDLRVGARKCRKVELMEEEDDAKDMKALKQKAPLK